MFTTPSDFHILTADSQRFVLEMPKTETTGSSEGGDAIKMKGVPRNVVAELAYLFRVPGQPSPILLLGAGASYRSGIPLANEAVKRIAKAAFAWNRLGIDENLCNPPPSDWMPYLESQEWFLRDPEKFAENFPFAVKHLLTPRERRRRFLSGLIVPPNGISDGYRALARIMLRRLCKTVLTTNFDQLVTDALRELRPNVREVIEVNRTRDDLVRFGLFRDFQVVYLHGSVEFYRDRNETDETKTLDDELVKRLRPMLRDSPLIVIGYRGYEQSIIKHLLADGIQECQGYPNGIFWCRRKGSGLHGNVELFRKQISGNFHELEIDGFDELLVALDKALEGCSNLASQNPPDLQPAVPGASSFDQRTMADVAKDELDLALAMSTMALYFERLKLGKIDSNNFEATLLELGIIRRNKDRLVPTVGGYLLFGKEVEKRFPTARVKITIAGHERLIVSGNLVTQLERLTDFLNNPEINPTLRIKGKSVSQDNTAYPSLALREACVNLLVHRDYEASEMAAVDFIPGSHLLFRNPGGLLSAVTEKISFASDGKFVPKRGITAIRNPLLADIFYGLGKMDKAGSGLADIVKFMVEHGGDSEFSVADKNNKVIVTLKQAKQEQPSSSNTAVSLPPSETYVTNLLPLLVVPQFLTSIPLKHKKASQQPLSPQERESLPVFIYANDCVVSFAPPEAFESYPKGELLFELAKVDPVDELMSDEASKRLLVWLIHRHWANYLWQFKEQGLVVEGKIKRAYFLHRSPYATEVCYVGYTSRMGRKIKRGVVKRRGAFDKVWHENEGLQYAAVCLDNQWALQLKPIYVFTGQDGWTPLPAHTQTRRATRRFKFDRNKSVDDDLTFWSRFLSNAQPVINIGGIGVDDLVLSSNYCQTEVPTALIEETV